MNGDVSSGIIKMVKKSNISNKTQRKQIKKWL
jgi:hypothetical protein